VQNVNKQTNTFSMFGVVDSNIEERLSLKKFVFSCHKL